MATRKKKSIDPIGQKIREIRKEKEITYEMLANETGLSVDKLKQIESGDQLPPVGILLSLSRALKVDSSYLLNEAKTNLSHRAKAFAKRTENYAYTTLTPGADTKRMKAFRITIDPMKAHDGVGYQHEGEEFVYVLAGKIELTVGEHVNTLDTGNSLHFNSGIQHMIRNISRKTAELLVVVCEP
jgi:transcriptional regulator with XRE-family HTH domain